MDIHPATNNGEPESKTSFNTTCFVIILFSLTLVACQQSQRKETIMPATGTLQANKQDSLTKAKLPQKKPAKKIYLTFDDGPNNGTIHVLQTIKEEKMPVSFFIVGKHVFDSPKQTAAWHALLADTSISLCNHSYSHAHNRYSSFYENPEQVVNDFKQSQQELNFKNLVVRMPGRNAWRIDTIDVTDIRTSKAAIDEVHHAGFAVMGWDIEWSFDHKTFVPDQDTASLYKKIFNLLDAGTTRTPGHLVLLAHDQAFRDTANLPILHSFLKSLKQNDGYEFVLADTYPGVVH